MADGSPQLEPDATPRRGSFEVGSLIAEKFRVERILGEGGCGVVVLVRHVGLDQPFALKYLQPSATANAAIVERFLREARLAAMIRSEHVVRVHDVATLASGQPYIVMEFLEGRDLESVVADGPLPVETAVDYIVQACDALAEAHAMGIVHRDLKPANLFLTRRAGGASGIKVLDFGISKLSERMSSSGAYRKLTTDTQRFGTPLYMPPEQLGSSTKVDERSDVWALGVVLYELITGMLPFAGETMSELCVAICTRPAKPWAEINAALPRDLEAIILKCLEKDPADRHHNVAELVQELAPWASAKGRIAVEHVVAVIREGGASIRPPSMSRPDFSERSTSPTVSTAVTTPEFPMLPVKSTTTTSWSESSALKRTPRSGKLFAAFGATALLGGAALALFALRSTSPPPQAQTAVPAPVLSAAPPTVAAAATPPATEDLPPPAPSSVASPSRPRPLLAPRNGASRTATSTTSPAPPAPPPAVVAAPAAPPSPDVPGDQRRRQFGERK